MPADTVTYVLELVGILAFATSGALLAIRSGFDVVGIVMLAETTALGGGVLRDLLLGDAPPIALTDPLYLAIPLVAATVSFFAHPHLARLGRAVTLCDAGGLGLFAVTGTLKALEADLGVLQAAALGVTTAVGGGVLRAVLARRTPELFRADSVLYAVPAAIGALVLAAVHRTAGPVPGLAVAVALAIIAVRLLALRRGWHAPSVQLSTAP